MSETEILGRETGGRNYVKDVSKCYNNLVHIIINF